MDSVKKSFIFGGVILLLCWAIFLFMSGAIAQEKSKCITVAMDHKEKVDFAAKHQKNIWSRVFAGDKNELIIVFTYVSNSPKGWLSIFKDGCRSTIIYAPAYVFHSFMGLERFKAFNRPAKKT